MFISLLKKIRKEIQWYSPLRRYFFPRYRYMFDPAQLCFMCYCIEKTRELNGNIAEIGVSTGSTTIFLNRYMEVRGIEKKFIALDTFSGFTKKDIQFEVDHRGKRPNYIRTQFVANKKKWFDWTVRYNKLKHVDVIQADINNFNLKTLGPLSFCLLDVDLYKPMKKALPELYEVLAPDGIIIVDDCTPNNNWDGSDQAYKEFAKTIGHEIEVIHHKLGVIRKPLKRKQDRGII